MRFILSGNLLRFSDFRKEISIPAPTLGEGLQQLTRQHPQLRPVLVDGEGQLRGVLRVFLNGQQLEPVLLEHALGEGDEITLLTAIAGG